MDDEGFVGGEDYFVAEVEELKNIVLGQLWGSERVVEGGVCEREEKYYNPSYCLDHRFIL